MNVFLLIKWILIRKSDFCAASPLFDYSIGGSCVNLNSLMKMWKSMSVDSSDSCSSDCLACCFSERTIIFYDESAKLNFICPFLTFYALKFLAAFKVHFKMIWLLSSLHMLAIRISFYPYSFEFVIISYLSHFNGSKFESFFISTKIS